MPNVNSHACILYLSKTSVKLCIGCLIGEINLFMSLPYEQTIYTRTVCTVMTIAKKDLMLSLQDFPHVFAIMRDRLKASKIFIYSNTILIFLFIIASN